PQGGLEILVSQTLPDGRQAHASIDQLGRVRVAQLVERAADPGLGTVTRPALLHRLISQRATPAILLGPEQRAIAVAGLLQVRPDLTDQARIIQQHRATMTALA